MDDVERIFNKLVQILGEHDASRLRAPIEVAEIYQTILPYRRYRSELGFDTNQDYEMAVLRLLSGEGGFASVDPTEVQQSLADEARAVNPNPGAFREYAAARVFLNSRAVDALSKTRNVYAPPEPDADVVEPEPPVEPPIEEPALPVTDPATATTLPFTAVPDDPPEALPLSPAGRPSVEGITTFNPEPADGFQPEIADSCPSCTRALPRRTDLRFCPFCGMDVMTPSCRFCGSDVDADWTFCVACGRRKTDDE